ncbi:ribosome silencing factor [bacterium]|nr:ribosome silencing factor [bacterium]
MTEIEQPTTREIVLALAETIVEKMGRDVRILDLRGLTEIADWFIIASVQSKRHLKILGGDLVSEIKSANIGPIRVEGLTSESWAIIDMFDIVVHLFLPDKRDFYSLEDYWADAPSETIGIEVEGEEDAV